MSLANNLVEELAQEYADKRKRETARRLGRYADDQFTRPSGLADYASGSAGVGAEAPFAPKPYTGRPEPQMGAAPAGYVQPPLPPPYKPRDQGFSLGNVIRDVRSFDDLYAQKARELTAGLIPGADTGKKQQIAGAVVGELARPSSIAAMLVPLAKGPLAARVVQNALRQGGANVAIDLLLGRTDPKQLALSAGLGATLGAALPEVGTAVKAIREYGASPEGQALVKKLASETGMAKIPGTPDLPEPKPGRKLPDGSVEVGRFDHIAPDGTQQTRVIGVKKFTELSESEQYTVGRYHNKMPQQMANQWIVTVNGNPVESWGSRQSIIADATRLVAEPAHQFHVVGEPRFSALGEGGKGTIEAQNVTKAERAAQERATKQAEAAQQQRWGANLRTIIESEGATKGGKRVDFNVRGTKVDNEGVRLENEIIDTVKATEVAPGLVVRSVEWGGRGRGRTWSVDHVGTGYSVTPRHLNPWTRQEATAYARSLAKFGDWSSFGYGDPIPAWAKEAGSTLGTFQHGYLTDEAMAKLGRAAEPLSTRPELSGQAPSGGSAQQSAAPPNPSAQGTSAAAKPVYQPKPGAEGAAGGMPASATGAPPPATPLTPDQEAMLRTTSGELFISGRVPTKEQAIRYFEGANGPLSNEAGAAYRDLAGIQPYDEAVRLGAAKPLAPEPPPRALGEAVPPEAPSPPPAATGGGEPPQGPPTAVSAAGGGDVLPPVIQRVVNDLQGASLTRGERQKIVRAGRARQASRIGSALEGEGTTLEKSIAARGAEKGRIVPGIKPIGEKYTAQEVDQVFSTIDQAYQSGAINRFEYPNATSALNLLFKGERLPTPSDARLPLHLMPHEIKLLGRIFGPEFQAALPKSAAELSLFQRAVDIANIPRSLKTMLDVSAAGRQGGLMAIRNPREWGVAFGKQIKAMQGESAAGEVYDAIRASDGYVSGQEHGLRIVTGAGDPNAEEAFLSTTAEQLPGVGRLVRGSERGYNAFLNYLRQGVYDKRLNALTTHANKHGWAPERLAKALDDTAAFINHATGQGDVGALREYVPAMNAVFFSPKYFVSRPQSIWDLVKPGVDIQVRKQVAENLGLFFGTGAAILAGLKLSGAADVEMDPRSTDFGKIRIGNQRIEFWAGYQPIARYLAQVQQGEVKDPYEGIKSTNRGLAVARFIRSKLSPVGALGWDTVIAGGRDYEGNKLNWLDPKTVGKRAMDEVTPLVLADTIEAYRAGGMGAATRALPSAAVGFGTMTYNPSEKQQKAGAKHDFATDSLKPVGARLVKGEIRIDAWDAKEAAAVPKIVERLKESTRPKGNFKTISELRSAMIEHNLSTYMQKYGVGEAEAKAELGKNFDALESVKNAAANEKLYRLSFWREHPDLLNEAQLQGIETLNPDEEKILQEAGLLAK